jgi:hypothetical protein
VTVGNSVLDKLQPIVAVAVARELAGGCWRAWPPWIRARLTDALSTCPTRLLESPLRNRIR